MYLEAEIKPGHTDVNGVLPHAIRAKPSSTSVLRNQEVHAAAA